MTQTSIKIYIDWEGERPGDLFIEYPIVRKATGEEVGHLRKERKTDLWTVGQTNYAGVLVGGYLRPLATWQKALQQALAYFGYDDSDYELVADPRRQPIK